uniref:tRNA pseudouridine synthase A isoform X3 n=1 Tax=Rhizophora mucronata TaxID=61149 RepID=A0A2P2K146_RHIMU
MLISILNTIQGILTVLQTSNLENKTQKCCFPVNESICSQLFFSFSPFSLTCFLKLWCHVQILCRTVTFLPIVVKAG